MTSHPCVAGTVLAAKEIAVKGYALKVSADGIWSLTMYNPEHFFYPNALKRYALGTKNKSLKYNPDGSLTIYLGTKSPGEDKESNWLPAPAGDFSIWLRAYWARPGHPRRHMEVADGGPRGKVTLK